MFECTERTPVQKALADCLEAALYDLVNSGLSFANVEQYRFNKWCKFVESKLFSKLEPTSDVYYIRFEPYFLPVKSSVESLVNSSFYYNCPICDKESLNTKYYCSRMLSIIVMEFLDLSNRERN